MKIARLFRPFIESHHYLNLPAIGKLEIIPAEIIPLTGEIEKNFIRFSEDKNSQSDPEFLTYVSKYLKVEASVAAADLHCFCDNTNELLIQGFEAEIPALGFLHFASGNKLKFSVNSIYNAAPKVTQRKPAVFLNSSFWL
jgi:hypothetical protein